MSTAAPTVPIIKPAILAGIIAAAASYFTGHKSDLLPTFGVMTASSAVSLWAFNSTKYLAMDSVEDNRLIPGVFAGLLFAGGQHFRHEGTFGMNFGIGAVSGVVANYWVIDKDEAKLVAEAKKKEE